MRGNVNDILGGLLFVAIGVTGAFLSTNHALGTADDMGAGYMPLGVFTIIGLLGAVIALQGLFAPQDPADGVTWGPALAVILGATAFALLMRTGGFFVATVALVGISSFADRDARFGQSLIIGTVLGLFGVLVFAIGLGVPLPVWPWSQ
jgi:hypothetical protein